MILVREKKSMWKSGGCAVTVWKEKDRNCRTGRNGQKGRIDGAIRDLREHVNTNEEIGCVIVRMAR